MPASGGPFPGCLICIGHSAPLRDQGTEEPRIAWVVDVWPRPASLLFRKCMNLSDSNSYTAPHAERLVLAGLPQRAIDRNSA
jgi:hypothetical protein